MNEKMRRSSLLILLLAFGALQWSGCSEERTTSSSQQTTEQDEPKEEKPLGPPPPGQSEPSLEPAETEEMEGAFTHTVTREAEFYKTGPQQAAPPDGKLSAGSKVRLVKEAGSYVQVETADGLQIFVVADVLEPLGSDQ